VMQIKSPGYIWSENLIANFLEMAATWI